MKTKKVCIVRITLMIIITITLIGLGTSDHSFLDPYYKKSQAFLYKHMHIHKTVNKRLVDKNGKFVEFSPYNYETLYRARDILDSLQQHCALVLIEEEDKRKISDDFIGKHIRTSLEIWQNSRFSKQIKFEDFTNYLLPYRAGNETFSNYRQYILDTLSHVFNNIKSNVSIEIAVQAINSELKKKLVFDLRSHADLSNPSMLEILEQQKGSCASLTQFTAMVLRTQGIPAAIDECPVWGHRNSGHQWNTFMDESGKWIPFGGAETNPEEFETIHDSVKAPKIYRHTYAVQESFPPLIENIRNIPIIFHKKNRIDVTSEYIKTSNVTINIKERNKVNVSFLYLAVFNAEKWKIVSWSKIEKGKAEFKDMGNNNIVYLPVSYDNGKIIPVTDPFLLTPLGKKNIKPDRANKQSLKIVEYNKFYDIKWNIGIPKRNWKMELFYWDAKWVSLGVCKVDKDLKLHYKNAPKNALYLIKSLDWPNTWQRIFTIEENIQTWY